MQYNYGHFGPGGSSYHPYTQSPSLQQQQTAAQHLNDLAGGLTSLIESNSRGGVALPNYSIPRQGHEQELRIDDLQQEMRYGEGGDIDELEEGDEDDEEYTTEQEIEFRRMGERRALLEQETNAGSMQSRDLPDRRSPYASTSSNGHFPPSTNHPPASTEPWNPLLDHNVYLNHESSGSVHDLQIYRDLPSTSTQLRQDSYVPDLESPEYEEEVEEVPPVDETGPTPFFVNAKQYHRILKRRVARLRLEEMGRLHRQRKVSHNLIIPSRIPTKWTEIPSTSSRFRDFILEYCF